MEKLCTWDLLDRPSLDFLIQQVELYPENERKETRRLDLKTIIMKTKATTSERSKLTWGFYKAKENIYAHRYGHLLLLAGTIIPVYCKDGEASIAYYDRGVKVTDSTQNYGFRWNSERWTMRICKFNKLFEKVTSPITFIFTQFEEKMMMFNFKAHEPYQYDGLFKSLITKKSPYKKLEALLGEEIDTIEFFSTWLYHLRINEMTYTIIDEKQVPEYIKKFNVKQSTDRFDL